MTPVTRVKSKPKSEPKEPDSDGYSTPDIMDSDSEAEATYNRALQNKRKSRYNPVAYRLSRMHETPEEREARLARLRQNYERKKSNENWKPKSYNAEKYRLSRMNETPEEKEARLAKLRERYERKKSNRNWTPKGYDPDKFRKKLMNETPEEKAERHAKQREKYRKKISKETPRQREVRLQALRERTRVRLRRMREEETAEEREERQRVQTDVRQLLAKCETDEQRRARRRGIADSVGKLRRKKIQYRHPLTLNLEDHDFQCELCSTTLIMRFRYVAHMHHHINRTGLRMDVHEPIVLYICDFTACHLCFRDKGRYVSHLESHSDTRSTFNCFVCRKPFAMESNCEKHVELAHGPEAADYVDCEYCHLVGKKEEAESHYATHQIRLDEKEANHICETCGKGFTKLTNLNTHIRIVHTHRKSVHRRQKAKRSDLQLKKEFNAQPCVVCDKLLINKKESDAHMLRYHTYEHGTECYECGKHYNYLYILLAHIRRCHTNEPQIIKRAKCQYCPRDFSCYFLKNKHHFIDHRAEYLRDLPFCCGICFRNFLGKDLLMNHLLVHERFKCPVCLLRSNSKTTHETHLRSHNIGPLAATKKRFFNWRKASKKRDLTIPENKICVDEAEERIIEGTNHYFERDIGWMEIPSDLNAQIERDSQQAQAEIHITNPVEADTSQVQYYYHSQHLESQSEPSTLYLAVRGMPEGSDSLKSGTIRESENEAQTQAEDQESESTSTDKPKKYICDRCPLQFNYPKYLLIHIAWHVGQETKNVEVVATPAIAAETVLSKNPTELELAKYQNPDYEEPENQGVVAKRHVCPECAQLFHHLPKLNEHRRRKHDVYVYADPSVEPVSCEICSMSFTRLHYLNRHMEMIHNPKPKPLRKPREAKMIEANLNLDEENPWTPASTSQDFDEKFDLNADSDEEHKTARKQIIISKKAVRGKPRSASPRAKQTSKTSRSRNPRIQEKWTCGECPMAFILESALKQHKLIHEAARVTKDYEGHEWILPDIKMEAEEEDEQVPDPDWLNDAVTLSMSTQNSEDEKLEEVQSPIQLSTLRQLKMRMTRSMSRLPPQLKQAVESLPRQLIVELPRVEIEESERRSAPKIEKEIHETSKKSRTTRKSVKRNQTSKRRKPRKESSKSLSVPLAEEPEESPPKPKRRKKGMGRKPGDICDICGKVLHPNTPLEAHLATHTKDKPFKCDICSRTYGHEKHLKDHRARYHREVLNSPKWIELTEKNTCPICSKLIKTKSLLESHVASHSGVFPFQCNVCNKKFPHERQMNDHKRRNHLENPPPKKSQKGRTLIKKPGFEYMCSEYYCDVCYKTVRYKSRFDRHMRTHFDTHPELETLIHVYHCDACPQAFRLHDHFLGHLMTHSIAESSSPIVCTVCNKAFAKGSTLESHMKSVHESVDTVFDCQYCHHHFQKEEDLRIHEKAHAVDLAASLEGSHMCPHCGQTFKLPCYLNAHILNAHDGVGLDPDFKPRKEYVRKPDGKVGNNEFAPCQVCGEKFGVRKALKNHLLKDHTYEHGMICYVCDKRFSVLGHLNRHLREFHKDDEHLAIHALPKVSKNGHRTAYSCPYCPVVYYGGTLRLNKHLFRVHNEEYMEGKPIYCQLCYKNFVTEEELVAHRPAHDGIKCDRCGEQFLRMAFLNTHMLRCTGELKPRLPKLAATSGRRTGNSGKRMRPRNPGMLAQQLELERSSAEDSSEGENYDEEGDDRPVYSLMEVHPLPPSSTHCLGLVEHPLPLNLVQSSPWPLQLPTSTSEQLQFSMESYLHWN